MIHHMGTVTTCLDWLEARNYTHLRLAPTMWAPPGLQRLLRPYDAISALREALAQAHFDPARRRAWVYQAKVNFGTWPRYHIQWFTPAGVTEDLCMTQIPVDLTAMLAYYTKGEDQ